MASSDSQPPDGTPIQSETEKKRGKTDPAWEYALEEKDPASQKKSITYLLCRKKITGGGVNKLKQYLAGKIGEFTPCKR
ncbi:hypothetical protein MKX03_037779, partial [Papaver bracteatum]